MKRSLRSWLWSVPLDKEVDEELAFHREMRARERRAAPPIGMRLVLRPAGMPPDAAPIVREIVGVARQVKDRADETEQPIHIYAPLAQNVVGDVYFLARTQVTDAADMASAIRAAIARVDATKEVSVREVMTLDDVAWAATGRHRFRAVLAATLAALALVLAMIGVFGVLGYAVQQRWREFGVRIALGATAGSILRMVAAGAGRLVLIGAVIGLAVAAIASRALSTFLFEVGPLDPATFGAVIGVLALTAAMAIVAPAMRAARVEAVVAIRD